jgi:hypothetical protein
VRILIPNEIERPARSDLAAHDQCWVEATRAAGAREMERGGVRTCWSARCPAGQFQLEASALISTSALCRSGWQSLRAVITWRRALGAVRRTRSSVSD